MKPKNQPASIRTAWALLSQDDQTRWVLAAVLNRTNMTGLDLFAYHFKKKHPASLAELCHKLNLNLKMPSQPPSTPA